MSAAIWNFIIEQNATFRRTIIWEDDDGPVDLTGWTAAMQIRDQNGELLIDFTPYISMDTEQQTLLLDVPASVTQELYFKNALFDVRLVHPGSEDADVIRLLQGKAEVSAAVTV